MCIQQQQIYNRKYSMNKKNGGNVPVCNDERQRYIMVPCGHCYVCRKKKARQWRMRLTEDIKANPNCKIVTLTFNTEALKELAKECGKMTGYELDNMICKIAVKRFRERWRKKYGRSIRHWLVTELGHGKTEHVHMHGIVWQDDRYILEDTLTNEVERIWQPYGWVGKGKPNWKLSTKNNIVFENYVNAKTANYFMKYVNKIDEQHKEYKQIILTSAGIGKNFLESDKATDNVYRGQDTNQMYQLDNGGVLPMPDYFRRKLYTDEQREKLTGWYLDKNIVFIEGREYSGNMGDARIVKMYKALQTRS